MDLNGTQTRTFSHNAAGNMLTDIKSSVATAYTYNNAGRMSAVSIGGTARGSYLYNANGSWCHAPCSTPHLPAPFT
jgi:YD repeat-containing protein